ncbi:citrate lyase acyl carrier protein [Photobacterium makurazakiensis]|uniref:citrate lyase acyl carrier protein n=1 Tax=Photobacterium makurazakiensis TaxID=2910234 RepID=UPI003D0E16AB
MKLVQSAMVGSLESNDCLVSVYPARNQVDIAVDSIVLAQFGEAIKATVHGVCTEFGVSAARIKIQDKGALDCVIKARVEAAILRAGGDHV